MKKIAIHIGFGKASSTLFQRYLFPNHPDINYLGGLKSKNNGNGSVKAKTQELLRAMVTHDSLEFNQVFWKKFYQEQVYCYLSDNKLNLISEEWLTLTPGTLLRSDRGLVAQRIFDIFGPDAKVLMIIRNQMEVIKSLFNNHLNSIIPLYSRDYSWSYRKQVDENLFYKLLLQTEDYGILSKYKYFLLAQKYMALFQERLIIKLYEDFNIDQELFLNALADDFDISVDPFIEYLPKEKVKKSKNTGSFISEIKKGIASTIKPDTLSSKDAFSGNFSELKVITKMDAYNFVHGYFKEDNVKMSKLMSIKLGDYGYPIEKEK